jgi:hypothetical protein
MAVLYRIRDWDKHFETFESRRIRHTTWVPFPVKHDGKGFRRLMAMRRGFEHYAAWVLIVQVAAKCPVRGTLADGDGPLTPADLAVKTGGPAGIFEKALSALVEIGWLECADMPADSTVAPAFSTGTNVFALPEGKGREQKGRELREARFAPPALADVEGFWTTERLPGDPVAFFEHFGENGWKVKDGNRLRPMRDWRQSARGWARRERPGNGKPRDPIQTIKDASTARYLAANKERA